MFKLYCDWDIGEGGLVFRSRESAIAWLRTNPEIEEMAEENGQTVDEHIKECFDEGYFQLEELAVI